ncbi:hypothetical protein LguiB_030618 [Lonicera macranthoides]
MAIKPVTIVFLLLFSLFLVLARSSLEWNSHQPEERLRQCQRQCESREEQQRPQCRQKCVEDFRREQEEQHRGGGGGGGGGRGEEDENPARDPKKQLEECRKQCKREHSEEREQQSQCEKRCERQRKERERGGKGRNVYEGSEEEEEEQQQQQQQEGNNPYVFEDQHFTTKIRTEHGRVQILQKFTERSKLLKGIENFRVSILEADPQTFIIPNHWDAEALFFVARGKGSISLVLEDKRESFNLRCGDVFRVPAGITVYLINRDNREKLVLAKLLRPVSTPGQFERVFGQQRQGIIIKASEEQIRQMSHHQGGGHWPFGGSSGQSKGPFNLLNKRPTHENEYGRLHEVDEDEYTQLEDLNVAVAFANITRGGMAGPYYNSEAIKISVVIDGEGELEMACPHLSGGSQESQRGRGRGSSQGSPSYQKVRARLRRGTVFIVPAGHPAVTIASQNQNLQVVCFKVNARNNQQFPLAGKGNVISELERVAKELAFGVPAREVEEVFGKQQEKYFFRGPRQQQQQQDSYSDA